MIEHWVKTAKVTSFGHATHLTDQFMADKKKSPAQIKKIVLTHVLECNLPLHHQAGDMMEGFCDVIV